MGLKILLLFQLLSFVVVYGNCYAFLSVHHTMIHNIEKEGINTKTHNHDTKNRNVKHQQEPSRKRNHKFSFAVNSDDSNAICNIDDKTILVDMDNVVCNWDKSFNEVIAGGAFGNIPIILPHERTDWNILKSYDEIHHKKLQRVSSTSGFFRKMQPIEGALKALKDMEKQGLNVFLCSSPDYFCSGSSSDQKHEWVQHHLGFDWNKRLILASDKTLVRGRVLIDDKPNCIHGLGKPSWQHILFSQPYNLKINDRPRLIHWNEWESVIIPHLSMNEQ